MQKYEKNMKIALSLLIGGLKSKCSKSLYFYPRYTSLGCNGNKNSAAVPLKNLRQNSISPSREKRMNTVFANKTDSD
jgi:hypothetical protein